MSDLCLVASTTWALKVTGSLSREVHALRSWNVFMAVTWASMDVSAEHGKACSIYPGITMDIKNTVSQCSLLSLWLFSAITTERTTVVSPSTQPSMAESWYWHFHVQRLWFFTLVFILSFIFCPCHGLRSVIEYMTKWMNRPKLQVAMMFCFVDSP